MADLGSVGWIFEVGRVNLPTRTLVSTAPLICIDGEGPARTISSGRGTIAGTCFDQDGVTPVARVVRAYKRSTGRLAGSVYSDEVTGVFSMTVDDAAVTYTVIMLPIADDENADGYDDILPFTG